MEKLNQEINLKWLGRSSVIAFLDVLIIMTSYIGALFLRFDFRFGEIPDYFLHGYIWSMPFWIIATLVVFYGCRLYHSIWRFASIAELERMVAAFVILIPVYFAGGWFMELHMPRS